MMISMYPHSRQLTRPCAHPVPRVLCVCTYVHTHMYYMHTIRPQKVGALRLCCVCGLGTGVMYVVCVPVCSQCRCPSTRSYTVTFQRHAYIFCGKYP